MAGKVAVITGASSGLGAEMARQLARAGWKVGLTARRVAELEALADSIRDEGGTACVAASDASDSRSTREAFRVFADQLGPVDLLIANAGISTRVWAGEFSVDALDEMIRVNLLGVARAIEAVLPSMSERRTGQIVGISSLAAFRGLPGSCGYCATKAGLSALLEGLRPDAKRFGVTITTIHPGYIRTPMTAGQANPQPFLMDAEPAARIMLKGIARGRSRVDFPWQMAAIARLIRILPDSLYDRLASRILLGSKSGAPAPGSESLGG